MTKPKTTKKPAKVEAPAPVIIDYAREAKTLKPLLSIAKQPSKIPLTRTIAVKDGRAYATDLDILISVASNLPTGVYDAKPLEFALKFGEVPKFSAIKPEDFPMLDPQAQEKATAFNTGDMAKVSYAMSKESHRYYLNGICLEILDSGTNMVATDGHRLAALGQPKGTIEQSLIIPMGVVKCLLGLTCSTCKSGAVSATYNTSRMVATFGDYVVVFKLIDGTFPDWRRVCPSGNTKTITCTKTEVEKAIAREKAEGQRNPKMKLALGDDFIGFNAVYLKESMGKADSVTLLCGSPAAPVIVQGGSAPLGVLMPMRV